MKQNVLRIAGGSALVLLLVGGLFWWGVETGRQFPRHLLIQGVENMEPNEQAKADFATFWEAWKTINDNYLKNNDVVPKEKVYGAISGLVDSLKDPNSTFYDPEGNQKFQEDIKGNFGGIGAEIGIRNEQIVIVAPLKNSPAMRAGLLPQDKIVKIDDASTEGMNVDESVRKIRGKEGTVVTLSILRGDWEKPKEFKIVRETITVPTLDFEMKENIALVKLYSFNVNALPLFYEATLKALSSQAKGMVLDLRNNPGGFLNIAVDLAGFFLPRGTLVVKEEGVGRPTEELHANGNEALLRMPIVVLLNDGSASASEILAGALRAHRNIKFVGTQSFGKGTVQEVIPLHDGSSLKLTVAHWVLPDGKILEKGGLEPDTEVRITEKDVEDKRDPQLEKALEVLQGEIAARK